MPKFYHWANAMPANEVYPNSDRHLVWRLQSSTPLLCSCAFILEAISLSLSSLGIYHRCHYALLAQEQQVKTFHERVGNASTLES